MTMPPLYAVLCFAAAGRYASIKLAAEELHVTPGAVSQQVSKLEDMLGVQLLIRGPRRIELTEIGRRYLREVQPSLQRIRDATARVKQLAPRAVTVSCTSGFAMQWLMPRLPAFQAMAPGCDVRIHTAATLVDLHVDGVDFAIRHGLGGYPGVQCERLIGDRLQPACSPALLESPQAPISTRELASYPLLHDEHREDWHMWLRAHGADTGPGAGTVFVNSTGAIDAAVAGLGIALVRKSMVRDELAAGKLVMPVTDALEAPIAYHLVYDSTALLLEDNRRFRAWLVQQAEADQHEFAPS